MAHTLASLALLILALAVVLTARSVVQARLAKLLGDDTAAAFGRASLNPLAHADLVGSMVLPLMVLAWNGGSLAGPLAFFAYAKVVPVNGGRFARSLSVRSGLLLVAGAGVLACALLAGLVGAAWHAVVWLGVQVDPMHDGLTAFALLVRVALAVLVTDLLPVYHLSGQKIVSVFLPPKSAWEFERFNFRYGRILLFATLLALHDPLSLVVLRLATLLAS